MIILKLGKKITKCFLCGRVGDGIIARHDLHCTSSENLIARSKANKEKAEAFCKVPNTPNAFSVFNQTQ